MTSLFLGLYGLYLLMVATQGNTDALLAKLPQDGRGYIPWILAIIVIAILSEYDATKPFVKPFIALLILNFALSNYDAISSEISKVYNLSRS